MKKSFERKKLRISPFDFFNYAFLTIFVLLIIYPFWNLLLLSFSDIKTSSSLGLKLWLNEWHFDAYRFTFSDRMTLIAYGNTIFRTVLGTVTTVIFCLMAAYPLSKKDLPGNGVITTFFLITMFFSGGLIPSYLLIRRLGLMDNRLVLIIPGMVAAYYIIIMRTFFRTIPKELEESAFIDGASYLTVLIKIIVPLSKPVLATIALWAAVGHWNAWFDCLIYIRDPNKIVLQVLIQRINIATRELMVSIQIFNVANRVSIPPVSVQAVTALITIGPIILIYPFAQKYFIKGITIGALKG